MEPTECNIGIDSGSTAKSVYRILVESVRCIYVSARFDKTKLISRRILFSSPAVIEFFIPGTNEYAQRENCRRPLSRRLTNAKAIADCTRYAGEREDNSIRRMLRQPRQSLDETCPLSSQRTTLHCRRYLKVTRTVNRKRQLACHHGAALVCEVAKGLQPHALADKLLPFRWCAVPFSTRSDRTARRNPIEINFFALRSADLPDTIRSHSNGA